MVFEKLIRKYFTFLLSQKKLMKTKPEQQFVGGKTSMSQALS